MDRPRERMLGCETHFLWACPSALVLFFGPGAQALQERDEPVRMGRKGGDLKVRVETQQGCEARAPGLPEGRLQAEGRGVCWRRLPGGWRPTGRQSSAQAEGRRGLGPGQGAGEQWSASPGEAAALERPQAAGRPGGEQGRHCWCEGRPSEGADPQLRLGGEGRRHLSGEAPHARGPDGDG